MAGGPWVTLQIEALDKNIEGQVTRVSPSVDPSSQTLQTTVIFDSKELPLLRPGMKLTAELKAAESTGATRFKNHIEQEAEHLEMLAKASESND